jgi:RNA polymerase sigma-70 factor (ECF subfamily)
MDDARLRQVMEQTHLDAFGWALHCCDGDREEAADLLQSVYVRILERRAPFDGRSSFKTWLFAVIRKSSLKRRRLGWRMLRSFVSVLSDIPHKGVSPDSAVLRSELQSKLEALLRELSARQQQVLRLVFYHGLTIEESARVLGIGLGSARTHYERGKGRLSQAMEREGLSDELSN